MPTFIQEFSDAAGVIGSFRAPGDALDGATIHLAWYGYGDWSGSSLVVFEKDGKLFEVHGYHCSCNGLEGQWEPEETTWEALAMRDLTGSCEYEGSQEADAELKRVVKENLPACSS